MKSRFQNLRIHCSGPSWVSAVCPSVGLKLLLRDTLLTKHYQYTQDLKVDKLILTLLKFVPSRQMSRDSTSRSQSIVIININKLSISRASFNRLRLHFNPSPSSNERRIAFQFWKVLVYTILWSRNPFVLETNSLQCVYSDHDISLTYYKMFFFYYLRHACRFIPLWSYRLTLNIICL